MQFHYCKKCQTTKPAAEFYKQKKTGKIRAGCCRACACAATRRRQIGRYKNNPAAQKERVKRYRMRHPAKFREIMRIATAKYRRKQRDAGQTFLPLPMPQNSAAPSAPEGPPLKPAAPGKCSQHQQPQPRKSKPGTP